VGRPISVSSIEAFLRCPYFWYMRYILGYKEYITYPLLCGKEVHEFIAFMERRRPKDGGRPYFYKSLETAQKAWFLRWKNALTIHDSIFLNKNVEEGRKYSAIGWKCISNYWESMENKDKSISIEYRSTQRIFGFKFITVMDQIRPIPVDKIQKIRPDLVSDGILDRNYGPFIILDLKTHRGNWMPPVNASHEYKMASLYHLSGSLQAIAYTEAFFQIHHVWPVAFVYYLLSENKFYYVFCESDESKKILVDSLSYFSNGINAGEFPKIPGNNCKICTLSRCCANSNVIVSDPELGTQILIDGVQPTTVRGKVCKQKRFRF